LLYRSYRATCQVYSSFAVRMYLSVSVGLFFQLLANGLMSGGMYALVASGLTLTLGVLKIFNFAQGQFFMLGAFVTFAVAEALGLPYPIAILAALISMAILDVLFYFGIIQQTMAKGFFSTMLATIFVATVISQGSLLTFASQERAISPVFPGTLNLGEVSLNWGKLLVIGCAIVVMVALYYFMRTKIGTAMLAAVTAAEGGASVIVFEKAPITGGPRLRNPI
jgi:branched-chain amino acid transport system permease protein